MSDLIPSINWGEFAKLVKSGELPNLKSCEVKFNGLYLFTAIISHGDVYSTEYIKTQAEYLAVKANISGGKDPEELLMGKTLADLHLSVS